MPYLISTAFDRSTASIVAGFLVFSSTLGRFGMGWLTAYIKSRYLMAVSLLLQALGLLVLSVTDTMWEAVAVVLLFGPGYGGVITLRLTLQAEYFGKKAFGAIQGLIMAIAIAGTMSFPYLTGLYYDMVGGYRSSWLIMAGLILAVTPLAFKLRRPETKPSAIPLYIEGEQHE
jgi:MFS family permease